MSPLERKRYNNAMQAMDFATRLRAQRALLWSTQEKDIHMPRSAGFWNLIAKNYARKPVDDENAYRHKLEVTQTFLEPDMKVLEFGCGSGTTALIHVPHVAHIDAIDYSRNMIAIARDKARREAIDNVTFKTASIEDWNARGGSYDAILGLSILHLLQDPDAVIAKVRDLLKPNGLFFSSTVCIGDMPGLMPKFLPIAWTLRIIPYIYKLRETELMSKLQRAGFEIEYDWRNGPGRGVFIVARAV